METRYLPLANNNTKITTAPPPLSSRRWSQLLITDVHKMIFRRRGAGRQHPNRLITFLRAVVTQRCRRIWFFDRNEGVGEEEPNRIRKYCLWPQQDLCPFICGRLMRRLSIAQMLWFQASCRRLKAREECISKLVCQFQRTSLWLSKDPPRNPVMLFSPWLAFQSLSKNKKKNVTSGISK